MSKREKVQGRKKTKLKKIIVFIFILLIAGGLVFMALKLTKKPESKKAEKKVVDTIENFDYTVAETDTKLFKEEFKKLKNELSKKEVDNKEYATIVAKLFVIDFFTLDNKLSKNDVGGVQFVYNNYKTTFIDKARDEFYKYVKSNLDDDRKQELPKVKTITVNSVEPTTAGAEIHKDEFNQISEAYKVSLSWTYEKDLGYQTSAVLIVVKDNDKFAVAKLSN